MVLIRADANEYIGVGHVMRCISVARALTNHGEDVLFLTADHRGDSLIRDFPVISLDSVWDDMRTEIEVIKKIVIEVKPHFLLVDSYYVTREYFNTISEYVKTAYIDDMNQADWNIDFLINYNIFAGVFDYSWYEGKRTKLMLGSQYTPLRDEFVNLPNHPIRLVTDIMISAGGTDPEHIIERMIQKICPRYSGITFHFIVGVLNPRLEEIKELVENNVILHINEKDISNLMMQCDIAISAAGITLYELCAAGIPTITYALADNQIVAAEQFDRQEIMISAGDCRKNRQFCENLGVLLESLIYDEKKRRVLSIRMKKLVDGNGAERIADILCGAW